MKKVVIVLTAVALTLGVLGRFFAKPVLAQVRAALTQNVDEPGRNPYQERQAYSFSGTCSGTVCITDFSPVPAGSRLVITNVSGNLILGNGAVVVETWVTPKGGADLRAHIPTFYEGFASGINFRQFNSPVQIYVDAGQSPEFFAELSTNPGGYFQNITLTGYYIKL